VESPGVSVSELLTFVHDDTMLPVFESTWLHVCILLPVLVSGSFTFVQVEASV
jgi:hypothetical protein